MRYMSVGMEFLVHKVAAGEKAAQDLSIQEAQRAAHLLLSGEATPAQAGGFLVGMRVKGETVEETIAFARAVRETNRLVPLDRKIQPLDIPVYAGKKSAFHAIIPAGLILAASGVPVLLHGFSGAPGRSGCAEVLKALGICTEFSTGEGAAVLEQLGFVYLDVSRFNPSLYRFQLLRVELGVRTIFNSVARMADPAGSGIHLIGISHPPYLELTAKALSHLGSRHAIILRGVEGGPEPSITGESIALELVGARTQPMTLSPPSGSPLAKRENILGGPPEDQAGIIRKIVSNVSRDFYGRWSLWTAALAFLAVGRVSALSDGFTLAEKTIENGEAFKKFVQLTE